jgi:hypothetical protein
MPWPSDSVADFPFMLTSPDINHVSNDFVAWDYRERVSHDAGLNHRIGVANT